MLTKSLLELLHDSAHIQRWNDHIRPSGGFTELDKQAHKMIIAYVLAKFEESDGMSVNWRRLIEGGLFEFLHRIVLTDIKPPIFYKLMNKHGQQLNEWVLGELEGRDCINPHFYDKFEEYLTTRSLEKDVLEAAHFLATKWEFKIVEKFNSGIFDLEDIRSETESRIKKHSNLKGVQQINFDNDILKFINLVGQLRFQQRWAQSPRVPETSVLGHMLIVANLAYLCSEKIGACDKRLCNNFFAGLFHDLPEVLTRDIISPVKSSVEGLNLLIKEIEREQVEEQLFPLLPTAWHKEIRYYIEDEFENKIIVDGQIRKKIKSRDIMKLYNEASFSAIDGEMIKGCDHFAAYIEAVLSIRCGITSRHLQEGAKSLKQKYENKKIAGIDFGKLFEYFQ